MKLALPLALSTSFSFTLAFTPNLFKYRSTALFSSDSTPKKRTASVSTFSPYDAWAAASPSKLPVRKKQTVKSSNSSSLTDKTEAQPVEFERKRPEIEPLRSEIVQDLPVIRKEATKSSASSTLKTKTETRQVKNVTKRPEIETLRSNTVQGRALRTWSFPSPDVERIQVLLKTEGRPLTADIELWQGPDNIPQKMIVYLDNGDLRSFSAVIESPLGSNTLAIRNTARMEYPFSASVEPDTGVGTITALSAAVKDGRPKSGTIVQGGAIVTYPFDSSVSKVSVIIKTDGRPMNARIELLQGPSNNKQVVDLYTENGHERPFQMIMDTPGIGNVVRVMNTATVEFPLTVTVEAILVEEFKYDDSSRKESIKSMNYGVGQNVRGWMQSSKLSET